ncbi:pyridoxal phosphate-dependent decarboxylase family protein [Micromonospora sp. NPDC049366]|uniref:pyridoxal phosphate-dependent decarboxylase family protein n=1 Tax=Micromonospora sp. NPDC049366 TaxID=3364271 RepID=UPI0037A312C0
MEDFGHLFRLAAEQAADFRGALSDRPVGVPVDRAALAEAFAGPLPVAGRPPEQVLADLVAAAEPGLVASAGPRYFGFVVGGASPAATAADIVAAGWDQLATNAVSSPAAIAAEAAAGSWLKELLGIPASASVGFVTGAQAANTVGLAAARHHVLAEAGWDVERRGLPGAPPIRVIAGEERHGTIDRSLRLLGLGTDLVRPVSAGPNGAIDLASLREALRAGSSGPTIVCLQAGNVNTGACDQLREACELVRRHGGWVHVDGAFGLWAAASPVTRHLVDGLELADSWACDGHKWLNLPYDSAFAICARPDVHVAAMSYRAAYLVGSGGAPEGADLTAESSRRARGFAVWAGLRELGGAGVAALVERCCGLARRFAAGLARAGFEVANEVVLNQVLVGFGDDARTDRVVAAVQADGTCWAGGTTWHGRRLMRISVSSATTTEADVDRSVAAITRLAA